MAVKVHSQVSNPPATKGKTGGKEYPGKFNIGEDASSLGLSEYQDGTQNSPDTDGSV